MSVEDDSCPICYEELCTDGTNVLQTECKHSFHTNCFLKHTSINGYKCPYCRHSLVETSNTEENDRVNTTTDSNPFDDENENYGRFESDGDYDSMDDEDGNETYYQQQQQSLVSEMREITSEDYTLAPFRWLMQQINDEVVEENTFPMETLYHNNDMTYQAEQQMEQENKDDVMELFTMINKKKIPYEKLLAAYMYHISTDYRHSSFSEKCNSNIEKALLSIHDKVLNRYCLRANLFDTYHSYDHEEE